MTGKTRFWTALWVLAVIFLFSGCFFQSPEELYALPQQSEEYYELQSELDQLLAGGASYAAPTSGSNQQSVQLADLDGDYMDEAVVFLKTDGEKPLKAYIYDRIGDDFQDVAVIEGDGTSFAGVEYVQIDGAPGVEMVLCRQVSDQVPQLTKIKSFSRAGTAARAHWVSCPATATTSKGFTSSSLQIRPSKGPSTVPGWITGRKIFSGRPSPRISSRDQSLATASRSCVVDAMVYSLQAVPHRP